MSNFTEAYRQGSSTQKLILPNKNSLNQIEEGTNENRWLASFIKIIDSREPKLTRCTLTARQVIRMRIWDASPCYNNCYRNEREITDLNVQPHIPSRVSFSSSALAVLIMQDVLNYGIKYPSACFICVKKKKVSVVRLTNSSKMCGEQAYSPCRLSFPFFTFVL